MQAGHAGRRLAVTAEHVGAEPWKARLSDALPCDARSEVELVVAWYGHIHADGIHQLGHLGALGQARHDRRRYQVAAEGCDTDLRRRAFLAQ